MKMYFAGNYPVSEWKPFVKDGGIRRVLLSYHYAKEQNSLLEFMLKNCEEVIIDSGAFSAGTLGIKISLVEYIKFIQRYQFKTYATLDIIGNAEETQNNTIEMRKAGLDPLDVFHVREDYENLKRMASESKYIALGGMVGEKNGSIVYHFLDNCFKIILKENPGLKVHGFGLTTEKAMKDYPWHSVDSSSWLGAVRFGRTKDDDGNDCHIDKIINDAKAKGIVIDTKKDERVLIGNREVERFLALEKEINLKHGNSNFEKELFSQSTMFEL